MRASRRAAAVGLVAALAILAAAAGLPACGSKRDAFDSRVPYVQDVSATRAVVAMVTGGALRLRVEVTPEGGTPRAEEEGEPGRLHGVAFDGLEPDTTHRYLVTDAGSGAFVGGATFRTAPLPGRRKVTFAAFGDSGTVGHAVEDEVSNHAGGAIGGFAAALADPFVARDRQPDLARRIVERDPDLCLHTGDIVYPEGERKRYADSYFKPFSRLIDHIPVFPTVGNHDVVAGGGAPFDEAFHTPANNPEKNRRYYSFDFGDAHFICLDGETGVIGDPTSPQRRWLEGDLAARERAWTIVYFHRPPRSQGKYGDDEFLLRTVVPVLEEARVDLVITGHDHNYQRYYPIGGITYVVTGGGGHGTYRTSPSPRTGYVEDVYHFVLGTVDARSLTLEAIDLHGNRFDAVTLLKDRD